MRIIIDIPDNYVGVIMSNQRMEGSAMDKLIRQAIIDGTPLQKGHGKIVDANRVLENGDNWEVETALMQTEAIIEADKEQD